MKAEPLIKPGELSNSEQRLVHALQLLGEQSRYKMFKLLMSQREMCVTEIAAELGITVSAVSQHFRNFEMVGLVSKERMGHKICYMLKSDDQLVQELAEVVNQSNNQ